MVCGLKKKTIAKKPERRICDVNIVRFKQRNQYTFTKLFKNSRIVTHNNPRKVHNNANNII